MDPQALWTGGGVVGLVVFLYYALATGKLYTGATVRELLAAKDEQISNLTKAVERRGDQVDEIKVVGVTVLKVLDTVERIAKERQS